MIALPQQSTPAEAVPTRMRELCEHDAKWREGKTWSLVYHVDDQVTQLLKEAYTKGRLGPGCCKATTCRCLMSTLTARSSSVTGLKGAQVPSRSAAMYGMMASLPNRGDLKEIVLDVLDQLTFVEEPDRQ